MMPEHSPVPPEACRGARVDDQRRTVPTSGRGRNLSVLAAFVPTQNGSRLAQPSARSDAPFHRGECCLEHEGEDSRHGRRVRGETIDKKALFRGIFAPGLLKPCSHSRPQPTFFLPISFYYNLLNTPRDPSLSPSSLLLTPFSSPLLPSSPLTPLSFFSFFYFSFLVHPYSNVTLTLMWPNT